jgi:hypothetical protein
MGTLLLYLPTRRNMLVYVKRKRYLISAGIAGIVAVGVWWWNWQAPYRTLTVFLTALETGDTKTLYALTPIYERRFVTPELIDSTYQNFLKPRLLTEKRLIKIRRTSIKRPLLPELRLSRVRAVQFYLWFQDKKGKEVVTAVIIQRPPTEEIWKVPFSTFVFNTCLSLYGPLNADKVMASLGFAWIALPEGGVSWVIK